MNIFKHEHTVFVEEKELTKLLLIVSKYAVKFKTGYIPSPKCVRYIAEDDKEWFVTLSCYNGQWRAMLKEIHKIPVVTILRRR